MLSICYHGIRDCFYNTAIDVRFSGRRLNGNSKTSYKHLGANDVYHTSYFVMPHIFKLVPISENDVLVDVGCGKGRVINYWLSCKLKNRIIGLELDPELAKRTSRQFSRWKNVSIIAGDAVSNIPPDGTIFYFYNPFCEEKVRQFEEALSGMFKSKPIKLIYYNPKSIDLFNNSKWEVKHLNFENDLGIKRWGRINKFHELSIVTRKT